MLEGFLSCSPASSMRRSYSLCLLLPPAIGLSRHTSYYVEFPYKACIHYHLYDLVAGYELSQERGFAGFFRYNPEAVQCGDKGLQRLVAWLPSVDAITRVDIDTRCGWVLRNDII